MFVFTAFLFSSFLLKLENKTKRKLQKQICQVVLDHFEKQYTRELGDTWTNVRSVVLGRWERRSSVIFKVLHKIPLKSVMDCNNRFGLFSV